MPTVSAPPSPSDAAPAALPVHYQWNEAALRERLLTGLTTGRLTVKTEAEAARTALLGLAPPSAATPHPAGYGLGLAIAERALATHGGTMHAKNRPEGGLVVVMRVPLAGR